MDSSVVAFFTVIFCFTFIANVQSIKNKIIIVDEDNWRDCLEGEWMIKFYAPWCPACRANEPDFEEFAQWSDELNIKVGTVDIVKNPGLSGRFMVTALPTFYHGKDGAFRRYTGDRKASSMEDYIESMTWKTIEPISWMRHPNSIQMTVMSWLFKTSLIMKTVHETITETYGFSSWASYAVFGVGTLVTGLTLGLLLVCVIDTFYPPKPRNLPPKTEDIKEEQEKKEEKGGEESAANTTDDESEASQREEELSQKSSRISQDWETFKEQEIEASQEENKSQLRKRKGDKDAGEAGDSHNNKVEEP